MFKGIVIHTGMTDFTNHMTPGGTVRPTHHLSRSCPSSALSHLTTGGSKLSVAATLTHEWVVTHERMTLLLMGITVEGRPHPANFPQTKLP